MARHFFGAQAELNFPDERLRPASPEQLTRALGLKSAKAPVRKQLTSAGRVRRASASSADDSSARRDGTKPDYGPSKYRGVFRLRQEMTCVWQAALGLNGKREFLGNWKTERDAAVAVDRARRHYHGDDGPFNFPKLASRFKPADAMTLRDEAHRVVKAHTSSRFRGVSHDPNRNLWWARIFHEGKNILLGRFPDELTAARTYDRAAARLRGKRAKLNFRAR
jgi:hypothetical protein